MTYLPSRFELDWNPSLLSRSLGFAGPAVILNTMCEADQTKFDNQCPADFQCAQYVLDHGNFNFIEQRRYTTH